jgi:asparagine synthase (glutamine-hydrolysing)
MPFDRWLRNGLQKTIDQTLRDPSAVSAAGLAPATVARLWQAFLDGAQGIYWSRIWALFVLIRWCRRHGLER